MYGGIVRLVAAEGRKSELLTFLGWDADVCRAVEPGTLRFDVWESPSEPNVVYLYEAYVDQDAFGAHKANEEEIVPVCSSLRRLSAIHEQLHLECQRLMTGRTGPHEV